jgi:hypothetical protein
MKCKCGLEMELWQSTHMQGKLVKRFRCVCGLEEAEIIEPIRINVYEKAKETKETKG